MKKEDLYESFQSIDDDMLERSEQAFRRNAPKPWKKMIAIAASLCILAAGALGVMRLSGSPFDGTETENESSAAAEPDHKDEQGVWIPQIQLPESTDDDMSTDMLSLVVYQGRIYTQTERFRAKKKAIPEDIIGEYIGEAVGSLDEWSSQDEYATELASVCEGSVYTVNGYDREYRLCIVTHDQNENGAEDACIHFLENLNGITLEKGKDLYGERLHVKEYFESAQYQLHEDWDWGKEKYHDISPDVDMAAFLDDLWEAPFTDEPMDYNNTPRTHLYLRMKDGTTVELDLYADGRVRYQHMGGTVAVQMEGEGFRDVFEACTRE